MSRAKFTPGPWNNKYGNFIYTQNKGLIATCRPFNGSADQLEIAFANARLMAAAPEMYALVEMIDPNHPILAKIRGDNNSMLAPRSEIVKPLANDDHLHNRSDDELVNDLKRYKAAAKKASTYADTFYYHQQIANIYSVLGYRAALQYIEEHRE